MMKSTRIIITTILIACGIAVIALFSLPILIHLVGWWQVITLFVPTILIALAFFVVAWQVAIGARWSEITDFVIGVIFNVY